MKSVRSVPAAVLLMLVACADRPAPAGEGPPNAVPEGVPDVAEIVCEADGSTTVKTPQVVVQPDGIHVHAISHLDEPASVVGLTNDIEPGTTDWIVTAAAPGRADVGCHPFSEHSSGEEPATTPMEVLDPDGLYVEGDLQCSGMVSNLTADFAEPPLEGGRVPLEEAEAGIHGLDDGDEVFHVGYPEQGDPSVAVRRHGQVVARYEFVTFDGDEWIVASDQICASSGLR